MERDSIVFYKDWWEAIQGLPSEKRLEAIAAVMEYAFTGVEPTDTMLRFATAQIRSFIDRDRKKYEETCRKRKEAIEKRWKKKNTPVKEALNTNEYNCIDKNTNEYKSIQHNTTQYYNDNDNENENENENEKINTSNYLQTDNNAHAGAREGQWVGKVLDQQIADCKASPIWKDGIRKKFRIDDPSEVDRLLDEFATDMLCQETDVRNAKKLFVVWLNERQQPSRKSRGSREPGLGPGEWRDEKGRRRFEKSDVIVPDNAPPRPSGGHYWNPVSGYWENML